MVTDIRFREALLKTLLANAWKFEISELHPRTQETTALAVALHEWRNNNHSGRKSRLLNFCFSQYPETERRLQDSQRGVRAVDS